MTGRETVAAILEKQGISNTDFAGRLGVSPQTAWNRLHSRKAKDVTIVLLADMLKLLGYKIMVVPTKTRCPEDGFEVDGKETIAPDASGPDIPKEIKERVDGLSAEERETVLRMLGYIK